MNPYEAQARLALNNCHSFLTMANKIDKQIRKETFPAFSLYADSLAYRMLAKQEAEKATEYFYISRKHELIKKAYSG